jgi:hypothetical protein
MSQLQTEQADPHDGLPQTFSPDETLQLPPAFPVGDVPARRDEIHNRPGCGGITWSYTYAPEPDRNLPLLCAELATGHKVEVFGDLGSDDRLISTIRATLMRFGRSGQTGDFLPSEIHIVDSIGEMIASNGTRTKLRGHPYNFGDTSPASGLAVARETAADEDTFYELLRDLTDRQEFLARMSAVQNGRTVAAVQHWRDLLEIHLGERALNGRPILTSSKPFDWGYDIGPNRSVAIAMVSPVADRFKDRKTGLNPLYRAARATKEDREVAVDKWLVDDQLENLFDTMILKALIPLTGDDRRMFVLDSGNESRIALSSRQKNWIINNPVHVESAVFEFLSAHIPYRRDSPEEVARLFGVPIGDRQQVLLGRYLSSQVNGMVCREMASTFCAMLHGLREMGAYPTGNLIFRVRNSIPRGRLPPHAFARTHQADGEIRVYDLAQGFNGALVTADLMCKGSLMLQRSRPSSEPVVAGDDGKVLNVPNWGYFSQPELYLLQRQGL